MTGDHLVTLAVTAAVGLSVTGLLIEVRLRAPPAAAMRPNFEGRPVPVVLGGPLAMGTMCSLVALLWLDAAGWEPARAGRLSLVVAVLVAVMFAAGRFDDRRGDERPRGFRGHLRAARGGTVTGGLVKLVTGMLGGIVTGVLVTEDAAARPLVVIEVALLVALSANLVNLLDRAPGRAGKGALLLLVPVWVAAAPPWRLVTVGLVGALAVCLAADLRGRAMLGDAGANPVGAVAGAGVAVTVPEPWRLVAVIVLAAANAASERWSFSEMIARTPWLRTVDEWGRARSTTDEK